VFQPPIDHALIGRKSVTTQAPKSRFSARMMRDAGVQRYRIVHPIMLNGPTCTVSGTGFEQACRCRAIQLPLVARPSTRLRRVTDFWPFTFCPWPSRLKREARHVDAGQQQHPLPATGERISPSRAWCASIYYLTAVIARSQPDFGDRSRSFFRLPRRAQMPR